MNQQSAAKTEKREVILHLPEAHARQHDLITASDKPPYPRFVVGACGSKMGKTFGCTIKLVQEAFANRHSLNWWVAPSYAQSKMAYALVKNLLPLGTYDEFKADLRIVLKEPDGSDHSVIEFKSGDNPDSLRGFAVNFFILDEAARMPEESFISVMTTVTQTNGKGIVISTPKGRGWFYEVYQRGEKQNLEPGEVDKYPEWVSIRMPTWTNPYVTKQAILDFKNNMPEDVFRQEIAAEFLMESAGVFRGIRDCVKGVLEPPLAGHSYIMGVDLAKLKDYTVLTVMDRHRRNVVFFDRFNKIDWEVQYSRIIEVHKRYNRAVTCMDSTGIGDPIVEALSRVMPIEPYKISSSAAKNQLIDKLRINIEQGKISFPEIRPMIKELEKYEYKVQPNGTFKYEGRPNDDCVISLALATHIVDAPQFMYRYRNVPGI